MATLFNMPKLGMDMEEGTIVKWLKAEGDAVKKGEAFAEIETDKSTVEVEAPCDGTVLKLYYAAEETLAVGTPIAAIGARGETPPAAEEKQPAEKEQTKGDASPAPAKAAVPSGHSAALFTMPKFGMDMEEGTIVRWLKAENSHVNKGEALIEVETDKSTVEVESPCDGIVLKLYYPEGAAMSVGTPIAAIGAAGDDVPPIAVAGEEPEEHKAGERLPAAPETGAPAASAEPVKRKKIRITPRAKRLAEKNNLDISQITATGPSGRIVEKDVREFLKAPAPRKTPGKRKREETVIPVTGIRKVISKRMHQSLSEMAQANHRMDADMTNMIALRGQLNKSERFAEAKISFVDLLIMACTRALMDCPFANVSLCDDGIHQKSYVNMGVAVDTPKGLVVPVLHGTDEMDLAAVSKENRALIEKAREGRLAPDEMSGGTFTISNLGMFGIDSFTAIVNPPEACILAVGRIAERAVAVNGALAVRPMIHLSLTYDHRILDGAPAARLLQRIQYYIENPALLLLNIDA